MSDFQLNQKRLSVNSDGTPQVSQSQDTSQRGQDSAILAAKTGQNEDKITQGKIVKKKVEETADYKIITTISDNGTRTVSRISKSDNSKTTTVISNDKETVTKYNSKGEKVSQSVSKDGIRHEIEYDGKGNSYIVVQQAESAQDISKTFGISLDSLLKANKPYSNPDELFKAGKRIKIPVELNADNKKLLKRKSSYEIQFDEAIKTTQTASKTEIEMQKQSARIIVDGLKKAIKGFNDTKKIQELLSNIDNPIELKEVNRLLELEGFKADDKYSAVEKFIYKENNNSIAHANNSSEYMEAIVQKWISTGVLTGQDAIDAQARMAARIIFDGADGAGTDCEKVKKGVSLIKSPISNNPKDSKAVYDKVNEIVSRHRTFYGLSGAQENLIDYLKGDITDSEIKYLQSILAQNNAIGGSEKTDSISNLIIKAVNYAGTDIPALKQALSGIKTPQERQAVEEKLKEYCLEKKIKPRLEGQDYLQAILFDECDTALGLNRDYNEIRKFNEMLIKQGAYSNEEALKIKSEEAVIQILEHNYKNIYDSVSQINDKKLLEEVNKLLKQVTKLDLDQYLEQEVKVLTKRDLIKSELASKNLLDDKESVYIAVRLLQEPDYDNRARGLYSIRTQAQAQKVDEILKKQGTSLEAVTDKFNQDKAKYTTKAMVWDSLAGIIGPVAEYISNQYGKNTDISDLLYFESETATEIPEEKKAQYKAITDNFEAELNRLKQDYQALLETQGGISASVDLFCKVHNIGTTSDDIEARIEHDTESLRLYKLASEGKLQTVTNGEYKTVSFEDVFKKRQSELIGSDLSISKIKELAAGKPQEIDAEKATTIIQHGNQLAAAEYVKEYIEQCWQELNSADSSNSNVELSTAIYNTLGKLSQISGQELNLEKLGFQIKDGIITDKAGKPIDAVQLKNITATLRTGLSDISKELLGIAIPTVSSNKKTQELLEKGYEEKVKEFKKEYEEAYGKKPPEDLLDSYRSTIQTGVMITNIVTTIGAVIAVPFTGGGSLAAFAAGAAATFVTQGVEQATDADGWTNQEFKNTAVDALWNGALTAAGMKVGKMAEKAVKGGYKFAADIIAKNEKLITSINPKISAENLKVVSTIIARTEATFGEVTSDLLQDLIYTYCREGEFNLETFTTTLILSAAGNIAGHAVGGVSDVHASKAAASKKIINMASEQIESSVSPTHIKKIAKELAFQHSADNPVVMTKSHVVPKRYDFLDKQSYITDTEVLKNGEKVLYTANKDILYVDKNGNILKAYYNDKTILNVIYEPETNRICAVETIDNKNNIKTKKIYNDDGSKTFYDFSAGYKRTIKYSGDINPQKEYLTLYEYPKILDEDMYEMHMGTRIRNAKSFEELEALQKEFDKYCVTYKMPNHLIYEFGKAEKSLIKEAFFKNEFVFKDLNKYSLIPEQEILVHSTDRIFLGRIDYNFDLNNPKIKGQLDKLADGESITLGSKNISETGYFKLPYADESVSQKHIILTKKGDNYILKNCSENSPTTVLTDKAPSQVNINEAKLPKKAEQTDFPVYETLLPESVVRQLHNKKKLSPTIKMSKGNRIIEYYLNGDSYKLVYQDGGLVASSVNNTHYSYDVFGNRILIDDKTYSKLLTKSLTSHYNSKISTGLKHPIDMSKNTTTEPLKPFKPAIVSDDAHMILNNEVDVKLNQEPFKSMKDGDEIIVGNHSDLDIHNNVELYGDIADEHLLIKKSNGKYIVTSLTDKETLLIAAPTKPTPLTPIEQRIRTASKPNDILTSKPLKLDNPLYKDTDKISEYLHDKMEKQMGVIKPDDISSWAENLSKKYNMSEQEVLDIMARLTQFGSFKKLEKLGIKLSQYDIGSFFKDSGVSANTSLDYISDQKHQFYLTGTKEAFVLDDAGIKYLENMDAQQREIFVSFVNNNAIVLVDLDGTGLTVGSNNYSYTVLDGAQNLEAMTEEVIQQIKHGKTLEEVLNANHTERIANLFGDEFTDKIKHISIYDDVELTPERITENITPNLPTKNEIKATIEVYVESLKLDDALKPKAKELLAKYIDHMLKMNSNDTFAELLKQKHAQILENVELMGKKPEDIVYVYPSSRKSYIYVDLIYAKANNIPFNSFKEFNGETILNGEKVVVLLDDVVGSGDSMTVGGGSGFIYDSFTRKNPKSNIIFSPITCAKQGAQNINNKITSAGRNDLLIYDSAMMTSFEDLANELSPEDAAFLAKILGTSGYYRNRLCTSFQYMVPDNATAFSGYLLNFNLNNSLGNKVHPNEKLIEKIKRTAAQYDKD